MLLPQFLQPIPDDLFQHDLPHTGSGTHARFD
jgi:hypothetical protein